MDSEEIKEMLICLMHFAYVYKKYFYETDSTL